MTMTIANTDQAAAWDGAEGDDWTNDWRYYDRAARDHQATLAAAAAVRDGERVLDIGCGTGDSTRDAARAAGSGTALGVDLSGQQLAKARELAAADGLTNVTFEKADAQVHDLGAGAFDVAISRFGAMFFNDQPAAFANIARSLRPGGRLAMVVWRGPEANEWLQAVFGALAVGRELGGPPIGAPGPFGLADDVATQAVLEAAGFSDVALTAKDAPFWVGDDGDDAFGFFQRTGVFRGLTAGLSPDDLATAKDNLRAAMVSNETPEGVLFRSGVWVITAILGG